MHAREAVAQQLGQSEQLARVRRALARRVLRHGRHAQRGRELVRHRGALRGVQGPIGAFLARARGRHHHGVSQRHARHSRREPGQQRSEPPLPLDHRLVLRPARLQRLRRNG